MTIKRDDNEQVAQSYDQDINPRTFLKNLSSQDFLDLGVQNVAYVRPVDMDGETHFAIHAADGTQLSVMEDENSAIGTIMQNDLEAVTVH